MSVFRKEMEQSLWEKNPYQRWEAPVPRQCIPGAWQGEWSKEYCLSVPVLLSSQLLEQLCIDSLARIF